MLKVCYLVFNDILVLNVNIFSVKQHVKKSASVKLTDDSNNVKKDDAENESCLIKCKQLVLTPK